MAEPGTELETQTTQWNDGVSETNQAMIAQKGWQNADAVLDSYSALEKSMGGRIKMPGDDSAPEEVKAFYTKLGCPDTPDGYKLPELNGDEKYDDSILKPMQLVAHEFGVTDKQFSKMLERFLGIQKQSAEAEKAEYIRSKEQNERQMKEKLGADYDVYMELSKRAYTELGSEELVELLNQDTYIKLLNEPVFIEFMNGIGKKMLDDTFVKGGDQVEIDKDYKPSNPNSPDMYETGDDEESKKARTYFRRTQNYQYHRQD